MYEGIILAGGNAWRLKPEIWIPKPLLKLNSSTLLERQINWLSKYDFKNIFVTIDADFLNYVFQEELNLLSKYSNIEWIVEKEKLGTGGAIKNAIKQIYSNVFYVFNIDDIVFYDPRTLFNVEYTTNILVSKPRLGYGRIHLRDNRVSRFQEKPVLDFYVSCGHYVLNKSIIDYLPDEGDWERNALPKLAKDKKLGALKYSGEWLTINNFKEYLNAKEYFKNNKLY